jgi:hypothetical protein
MKCMFRGCNNPPIPGWLHIWPYRLPFSICEIHCEPYELVGVWTRDG